MATPVVVTRIQNRRGTQAQFDGLYPAGYTGVGGFDPGYISIPPFTIVNFPGVLAAGEIALCTDTRRMFIGNISGEYIEIGDVPAQDNILLNPLVLVLPPAAIFTVIPALTYTATPFTTILYDITDVLSPDWNTVGTTFSRNGQLEITATAYFAPIPNPPFPDVTSVVLSDTGTEVNTVLPNSITFKTEYDGTQTLVEISYMHDFAGSLTFSSSSIKWLPF